MVLCEKSWKIVHGFLQKIMNVSSCFKARVKNDFANMFFFTKIIKISSLFLQIIINISYWLFVKSYELWFSKQDRTLSDNQESSQLQSKSCMGFVWQLQRWLGHFFAPRCFHRDVCKQLCYFLNNIMHIL